MAAGKKNLSPETECRMDTEKELMEETSELEEKELEEVSGGIAGTAEIDGVKCFYCYICKAYIPERAKKAHSLIHS